eukprot:scaffold581_cov263-Pinguiococcus_pyrenoidosus.AAC.10
MPICAPTVGADAATAEAMALRKTRAVKKMVVNRYRVCSRKRGKRSENACETLVEPERIAEKNCSDARCQGKEEQEDAGELVVPFCHMQEAPYLRNVREEERPEARGQQLSCLLPRLLVIHLRGDEDARAYHREAKVRGRDTGGGEPPGCVVDGRPDPAVEEQEEGPRESQVQPLVGLGLQSREPHPRRSVHHFQRGRNREEGVEEETAHRALQRQRSR